VSISILELTLPARLLLLLVLAALALVLGRELELALAVGLDLRVFLVVFEVPAEVLDAALEVDTDDGGTDTRETDRISLCFLFPPPFPILSLPSVSLLAAMRVLTNQCIYGEVVPLILDENQ